MILPRLRRLCFIASCLIVDALRFLATMAFDCLIILTDCLFYGSLIALFIGAVYILTRISYLLN